MPDAFYKYMSFNTAKIVIENQTLRWTTPATLNDPYDIQFDLKVDFDRNRVMTSALEKSWKVYSGHHQCVEGSRLASVMDLLQLHCPNMPKDYYFKMLSKGIEEGFENLDASIGELNSFVRKELSTCKILCLTDSPTNQLMWAYYGESNKGVVLKFENVPGADSPYTTAKEVNYVKEIPRLFDEEGLSDFLAGLAVFDEKKRLHDLIYTKSDVWVHEREWRIFSGNGRNKFAPHEDIRFGAAELSAVILGCRMPEPERKDLAILVKGLYPHAEVLQAATVGHTYELELKRTQFCN